MRPVLYGPWVGQELSSSQSCLKVIRMTVGEAGLFTRWAWYLLDSPPEVSSPSSPQSLTSRHSTQGLRRPLVSSWREAGEVRALLSLPQGALGWL